MKIKSLLKEQRTFSFEVFPPKAAADMPALEFTLSRLFRLKPDFVSVTYGAGGTNRGRAYEVCEHIVKSGQLPLLHFTCVGNSREQIERIIGDFLALGVENILLLRGDFPKGSEGIIGDFAHATDIIRHFRAAYPQLCIAAAVYPETHIDAVSPEDDIRWALEKQEAGAELLMTQLCYDVSAYERFMERLRAAGVTLPVIVGVMPVLSADSTIKMTLSNGCSIPAELAAIMGRYRDDAEAFRAAGKDYTARLIERYRDLGADGIHIYTLNKHEDVSDIVRALRP
ncbi:MAG: methylenetetrahydrofolate reductase [Clostridiales Family XIII bacterium]|jgi:methylenetetrahydrofolate reductase (NADPH)|nr:methylenetetrahydrofolate reductase [Clostridiales Family XIII bacterium]